MPPKKNKKKNKKKVEDNKKLSNVEIQFYELEIADIHKKIAHAQAYIATLKTNSEGVVETVRSLWEDKTDECADLSKDLQEKNDTINELNTQINEIEIQTEFERKQNHMRIRDFTLKYQAMYKQLGSKVKKLTGRLHSIDDFYKNWDILLKNYDETQTNIQEAEEKHNEEIAKLQEKRICMRDTIQKDLEEKLMISTEQFMRSSEERNSGYTRRIIRENIALQKEIYLLILSQLKIKQKTIEAIQSHNLMINSIEGLDMQKKGLILESQHRIELIQKLTNRFEVLKCHYQEDSKYPELYRKLVAKQLCTQHVLKQQAEQMRKLRVEIENVKFHNHMQEAQNIKCANRVAFLKELITLVRNTIAETITGIRSSTTTIKNIELDSSDDLLVKLLKITISAEDEAIETPSVISMVPSHSSLYQPGQLGFVQSSGSMMDIFEFGSEEGQVVTKKISLHKQLSKIIPKERLDKLTIYDVIEGSELFYSSEREGMMQLEEEHELSKEDDDIGSDDSSSMSSSTPRKKQKSAKQKRGSEESDLTSRRSTIMPSKPKERPQSTIIDVGEVEEEYVEEEEIERAMSYGNEEEELYY